MQFMHEQGLQQTRRHFLRNGQYGLGGLALASLLGDGKLQPRDASGVINPLAPKVAPHCRRRRSG